jgi:uncharacterized repeat protein (TIGR01451 family)
MKAKHGLVFCCAICVMGTLVGVLIGCGGSGSSISTSGNWSISLSQSGSFAPGGLGQYSITATNSGSGATSGLVTVTNTLPSGFTPSGPPAGNGWNCTESPLSCTRSDALPAGSSYPVITLNVNVPTGASGTVMNSATVSGGGLSNATGSIQTQIGTSGNGKIQHIVIIFQENRTPDNLFQGLCIPPYGSASACGTGQNQFNIQSYGYVGTTKVALTPVSLVTDYDQSHGHDGFLNDCNWNGTECAMNGWNADQCSPSDNCPANPQMQYVEPSVSGVYTLQPYLTMAQTYTFNDNMFQTNQGPSFPAHQYILSGTSAVCLPGATDCPSGTTSVDYVAGNPESDTRADGSAGAGCLAPPGSILNLIDTSQPFPNGNLLELDGNECFEHPTLTDLLDNAVPALTWRYYAALDGDIWTAPNAINHMCDPAGPQDQLYCNGPDWTKNNPNVVIEGSAAQVITDIQNGELANVTWIIPDSADSDHADGNTGLGPSWVASLVNTIGQSQFWGSTAIIVAWDDWGGWYDHVPPPIRNGDSYPNSYEYGYRVPLIAISPYAKAAYVSHQQNDFGSVLKFIEEQFSLPTVGQSAGVDYADSYALGDLSDCFDFSQTPLTFTVIPSDHDAKFFQNRTDKPLPPDND